MSGVRTGLAGLAGVLLLAGCGGAAQTALSTAATTGPATATTAAPGPGTTDPVPVDPPTSAAPAAGPCPAAALRVTLGVTGGTAGHQVLPVVLTNTGTAPCTVTGHPAVHLLAGAAPVGPVAAREAGPAGPVLLAPAEGATATVSIARAGLFDPADCRPAVADALSVVAPGGGAAQVVRLPDRVDACAGAVAQVSVTAVAAG